MGLFGLAVVLVIGIVALPPAENPGRAGPAALGGLAVIAAGGVGLLVLRELRARGLLRRMHKLSKRRNFGLELRIPLIFLFALAGLAQLVGVSIMLAGFVAGLVVCAGSPSGVDGSGLYVLSLIRSRR